VPTIMHEVIGNPLPEASKKVACTSTFPGPGGST